MPVGGMKNDVFVPRMTMSCPVVSLSAWTMLSLSSLSPSTSSSTFSMIAFSQLSRAAT